MLLVNLFIFCVHSVLHVQPSDETSEEEETEREQPPMLPVPPYQETEWTDITADFFGAVKGKRY